MQRGPEFSSILQWRYQTLADEARAYARAVNDPYKKRIFEDLADGYLKLAATKSSEAEPPSARVAAC
jgi:hypothetical protein